MILEGLVTTLNEDGSVNIAPMGPRVSEGFSRLLLRPFPQSQTYANLKRTGQGVFHVTDDVEMLARAAVHQLDELPRLLPAELVEGVVLADACRWYAFRVQSLDESQQRMHIDCQVVAHGRLREFLGFNRAKHAVLEAAIIATRLGILPNEEVRQQFTRLATIVDKTAGPQERQAFQLLERYVAENLPADDADPPASPFAN